MRRTAKATLTLAAMVSTVAVALAWTMRVTDYNGQQATQQFTITIQPGAPVQQPPGNRM